MTVSQTPSSAAERRLAIALVEGQQATVLQPPAEPQKAQEGPAANRAVQLDWAVG